MTLLAAWLEVVAEGRRAFPQPRTWKRGVQQALGSLVCLGRRCLSRIIWTNRRAESQLERGILSPLALSLATAGVVSTDSPSRLGFPPGVTGWCGRR